MGHNKKKAEQLGMPHGTAQGRLRKQILFALVQYTKLDICFRCHGIIKKIENLSIEHKVPWLDSEDPVGLFFDMDNIAFSHTTCNYRASRGTQMSKHGTARRYEIHACRCRECKDAHNKKMRDYRKRKSLAE